MARREGSRTMDIVHKGTTISVRESHEGTCVLEVEGRYRQVSEKKFNGACREAMKWILEHGGDMRGSYDR